MERVEKAAKLAKVKWAALLSGRQIKTSMQIANLMKMQKKPKKKRKGQISASLLAKVKTAGRQKVKPKPCIKNQLQIKTLPLTSVEAFLLPKASRMIYPDKDQKVTI